MQTIQKLINGFKALNDLGPTRLFHYLRYQVKLRSGLVRAQTPVFNLRIEKKAAAPSQIAFVPSSSALKKALGSHAKQLLHEADEILSGKVRLFGGSTQALDLEAPEPHTHWTRFEGSLADGNDIKVVWEMGRFCWATTLARAFLLSGDDKYAAFFWSKFEEFCQANPANLGAHWSSAQEVALRLISFAFCYPLFRSSPESSSERIALLSTSIAAHADRILPTLSYAKAQDNNHLLSETLGLMTAALLLPDHPRAKAWMKAGKHNYLKAINRQIAPNGSYSQQSSNYQRLMLQLGLWANLLFQANGERLPQSTQMKMALASQWQRKLLDESSGQMPNTGPNDGAYILPLSTLPFSDHRPVVQAAGRTFLGKAFFPAGEWDEMSLWLSTTRTAQLEIAAKKGPIRIQGKDSWSYLRAAHFSNRPGHADQLHMDLWWRGINLARDPGSFLYNAPAPWNNALASSRVHNTLTVNGEDQMTANGPFLWLDWAQARLLDQVYDSEGNSNFAKVAHNGYRKFGLRHEREVRVNKYDKWEIIDKLYPLRANSRSYSARLHWLLPDLEWRLEGQRLFAMTKFGEIQLQLKSDNGVGAISVFRAGELVHGAANRDPIMGWYSPTYTVKEAALSIVFDISGVAPIDFTSLWTLPSK